MAGYHCRNAELRRLRCASKTREVMLMRIKEIFVVRPGSFLNNVSAFRVRLVLVAGSFAVESCASGGERLELLRVAVV
jgi:hypothetical protein